MDRVLVTGGAGFLGSHVSQRLLADGTAVRVLDNLDPFYDPAIKRRNLAAIEASAPAGGFELLEGDLRDAETCRAAVEGVRAVIHLGALAGVRPSIEDPVRYMDVNVTGTQTLLEAVRSLSGVPFIFGSSSSVYGGNDQTPFAESHPVDHPVSPYAASKKSGEVVCHAFHHLYGNPVSCLRLFTVYGPRQRPEMAIHKFSRRIMAGQPIPFFGGGDTARDYTYVSDVVDGIMAALAHADGYHVYNLGGSVTTSLQQLVQMLEQVLGREAILERLPAQAGDMLVTHADTSLARREIGYVSRVPVEEGLRRFAEWYVAERSEGHLS